MNVINKSSDVEQLITSRRTIHEFRKGEVPSIDIIKHAIEVARWAPNHHLTEPWHCYLPGNETIQKIIELNTEITQGKSGEKVAKMKHQRWSAIPGWMVISCDISGNPVQEKEDYAACCCLVQNMMLYLWSCDIGVKWSTGEITRSEKLYDLLWIDPKVESIVGLFWYGYASEIPETTRNDIGKIIVELP